MYSREDGKTKKQENYLILDNQKDIIKNITFSILNEV